MLAFGEAGVVLLEICACGLVVLVLIVGERKEEECVLGFLGAFEYLGHVFKGGCCLGIFLFLKCPFGKVEAVVGVIAFEHALIFAARCYSDCREQYQEVFIHNYNGVLLERLRFNSQN